MPDHVAQPARSRPSRGPWELVWRGVSEMDASLAAAALEAEGVMTVSSARVPSGTIFARNLGWSGGDFRISVPLADAPRARELLLRCGQGRYIVGPNRAVRTPVPQPWVVVVSTVALIVLVLLLFLLLR